MHDEVSHARNGIANSAYSQIDEVNGESGINTVSATLSFDDIIALAEKRGITNTKFDNMVENISDKENIKDNIPIELDNPFV